MCGKGRWNESLLRSQTIQFSGPGLAAVSMAEIQMTDRQDASIHQEGGKYCLGYQVTASVLRPSSHLRHLKVRWQEKHQASRTGRVES